MQNAITKHLAEGRSEIFGESWKVYNLEVPFPRYL